MKKRPDNRMLRQLRMISLICSLLWWLCLKAYASRLVYLLHYGTSSIVSPALEAFAPTSSATLLASLICLALLAFFGEAAYRTSSRIVENSTQRVACMRAWTASIVCLALATAPWLADLFVYWSVSEPVGSARGLLGPGLWQLLWFAGLSGLAVERLIRSLQLGPTSARRQAGQGAIERYGMSLVLAASLLCGIWWFHQSEMALQSFLLGFNDCGHFAQRIANTAAGRGWLLETPVLPAFWDHFNPGLTFLVPLWYVWPSVSLFSCLQAVVLAGCAPLIMLLARSCRLSAGTSCLWGLAWLIQPIAGQMNLAYSYGWHPISMAIPFLILALVCVVRRWRLAALGSAIMAASFEEGVIVVIATSAASFAMIAWMAGKRKGVEQIVSNPDCKPPLQVAREATDILSTSGWIAVSIAAAIGFIAVFQWSGLARFQTGRFHALGDSVFAILASPLLRPDAFWGLLLRSRNAIFLAGLLIPCFLPSLRRGWPLLIPTVLPSGVIMVWDHLPAQSLAFQYSSSLLPLFWISALLGSRRSTPASPQKPNGGKMYWPEGTETSYAGAALCSCITASFFFGQMPWSVETLSDVVAVTMGNQTEMRRNIGSPDNGFAHKQLKSIRQDNQSVLATGRMAAHLVGVPDIETVGQYFERREALAKLTPDRHPLLRYHTIILDRLESFQQSRDQTAQLERDAIAVGFRPVDDQYQIVVLRQFSQ